MATPSAPRHNIAARPLPSAIPPAHITGKFGTFAAIDGTNTNDVT